MQVHHLIMYFTPHYLWRRFVISSLLMLLLLSPKPSTAMTFYALPSLDTPCPEKGVPNCMTLSQYAEKAVSYFSPNTTLFLLPGNHTLDRNLTLNGLHYLHIETYLKLSSNNSSMSDVSHSVVICSEKVKINIYYIDNAYISGITAVGCDQFFFTSLDKFTLTNSYIVGNKNRHGGILVSDVTEVLITECLFSANTGLVTTPINNNLHAGGALVFVNNKFISITKSYFYNNSVCNTHSLYSSSSIMSAAYGGALYVYMSTIQVDGTTFINNTASDLGGAIYVLRSDIAFTNCNMSYNQANQGGTIYADVSSIVRINNSIFRNNN